MLDALLGNAVVADPAKIQKELQPFLVEGEEVVRAFKLFRDLVVFTQLRLIQIDKQGLTGKKREIASVPYKSIDTFSVETAGTFDRDAELRLWVKGRGEIKIEIRSDIDVADLYRLLSYYILA